MSNTSTYRLEVYWHNASGTMTDSCDCVFMTSETALRELGEYDLMREYRTEQMCGGRPRQQGRVLCAEVSEWDGEDYIQTLDAREYGPLDYDRDFD